MPALQKKKRLNNDTISDGMKMGRDANLLGASLFLCIWFYEFYKNKHALRIRKSY